MKTEITRERVEKLLQNDWRIMQQVSPHAWVIYCMTLQAKLDGLTEAICCVLDAQFVEEDLVEDLHLLAGMMARMAVIGWRE